MSTGIETPKIDVNRLSGPAEPAEPAPRRKPEAGIGGAPRVDLLPLALRQRQQQKRLRRRLGAGVVGIAVLVAVAVAGGATVNGMAQASLASAQDETLTLLAQRGQYSELSDVQDRISLARAAQAVGASPEVDWNAYLGRLRDTLPSGVTLTAVSIDSASATQAYEQPTGPLEGPRIATLAFTALSPKLPDVPEWLTGLGTLPAFVDAVPNSVTRDESGSYIVNITLHVGPDAFTGRFTETEGAQK
ncbi:MAG: hypothetical protein JWR33_828 [Naasia sp.]|jgi:hypothetical protein|uniref:hypothetical protein n=1 Tax=Naasia sp. TaxID=2546198 RepID=UPI00260CE9F1|nr:hypothetical protein [Naasia sp.]MCU1570087.1 hypothetical protein [Naasia sp.]